MFTNGNGIYIYNKETKTYKYYCYKSNLEEEDFKKLKENENFISYFEGQISIIEKNKTN